MAFYLMSCYFCLYCVVVDSIPFALLMLGSAVSSSASMHKTCCPLVKHLSLVPMHFLQLSNYGGVQVELRLAEEEHKAHMRALGNIRFVRYLHQMRILTERILELHPEPV
jgi:hypothetical protein